MISSVEFDYRFTSSAGVGGQLILPAPNAAVFSLYSFGGFTGTDYKLSATGSGNDDAAAWGAERGQIGDIFEIVYVQGGADEDPDALFAAGTRRRGAELVFNVIPTYDSRNVGPVVSSFVDKSVVVNDKKTKLIDTPSALSTRMRQIFGSISAPEDVESGLFIPGYSLAVQNQNIPGLTPPFDAKRITYAGVELTVSPWSMYYNEVVNFPFTAFPAPVITEERVSDVLSFSLIQNFGFAEILRYEEFPSASFGLESYGATPFIYKILDNTYTFNDYDIPDSLTELFALLSPMPSKFQVYSRQFLDPDTEEIIDYYTSDRTQIPFFTYKNIEENYRPGADWYDFYNIETGAPNIPGVPAQFSKTLAPLSSRIELMNPFNAGLIVSTTFGESAYCLQSLAALGFSSSDLRL
jgi:hypothetical protein